MESNGVLNVCTALDKAFTIPTNVMLQSVIDNTDEAIHFHILVPEIEFQTECDFLKLSKIRPGIYFSFYQVKDHEPGGSLSMNGTLHFSNAALYRIFMAELLPVSVDRILYLDGDTLIDTDIQEIFATYPGSIISARIENFKSGYFNSGVLITSLQYWRENNVTEKLVSFLIDNPYSIYKDQDALNSFFQKKNTPLDEKYNYPAMNYGRFGREVIEPSVYHFTGTIKPWKSHAPRSYPFKLWRRYCQSIFPEYNFRQQVKLSLLKRTSNNVKVFLRQLSQHATK